MKKIIILICLLFICARSVHALYDPLSVSNNKFGIHIVDENDLQDAANLVNSSSGDWGYVKLVIREDDRNKQKWQNIFDRMRKLHLIPIIRLATKSENGMWTKPTDGEINNWVEFLNSLNWVIENRYIIIFNEPNHDKEWGGSVNPEEYALFLKTFSQRLKQKNEDFFILPAGLDASAGNTPETMDEALFIQKMIDFDPQIFTFIDGWSSHSYPNPDFSGNPGASGRGTVKTYLWEKELLSGYGTGNLPVFITETGWKHNLDQKIFRSYASPETVGDNMITGFQQAWNNDSIVAVIPFILNYQGAPFDQFSWKKPGSNEFYSMYSQLQSFIKVPGEPRQKHQVVFTESNFAEKLVTNSTYTFYFDLENQGQSIIDRNNNWLISVNNLPGNFSFWIDQPDLTEPFQRNRIEMKLTTPKKPQQNQFQINLVKDRKIIASKDFQLTLVPPPSILIQAKLWLNRWASGGDYSLRLFDDQQNLVEKIEPIVFDQGYADVENLYNIIPNRQYRLVLNKPYYLPGETQSIITETKTGVTFPMLLPFDPSDDDKINLDDISAFFKRPLETFGLLLSL